MKQTLGIYELIFEIRNIVVSKGCNLSSLIIGDLMIDAVTISKMKVGDSRLLHIGDNLTWMSEEPTFEDNEWRITRETDMYYSITKTK